MLHMLLNLFDFYIIYYSSFEVPFSKIHFIQFVQLLNTFFHTLRRDQMMATQFGT